MFNTNTNGYTLSDIAAVTGNNSNNGNNGFGFNGNDSWLFLLFILFLIGGWNNNGYGNGGGGTGYITNDIQRGFDQSALTTGINSLATNQCNGFAGIQQALCNGFAGVNGVLSTGFAGVNAGVANGFAQAEIANNARQIADMNQNFAAQTSTLTGLNNIQAALQNCCCENRAATADLKYTVATEACADRQAVTDALFNVTTAQTAGNQQLLNAINAGIQSIRDDICQEKIENLKAQNQQLQMQGYLASLAASQNAQTGQLLTDNTAQTTTLLRALNPAPVPAYIVSNPNGCNCGNLYGGCNGNGFYN